MEKSQRQRSKRVEKDLRRASRLRIKQRAVALIESSPSPQMTRQRQGLSNKSQSKA